MRSSYSENDVILLLKDITGLVEPLPAKVREKLIQAGVPMTAPATSVKEAEDMIMKVLRERGGMK